MKVTLINTLDSGGGAALACRRLMKALELKRIDVEMLVQQKRSDEDHVHSAVAKFKAQYNFLAERLPFIFFHERDRSVRFAFSTAKSGTAIIQQPEVLNADLIHLHWTNSGFLSIDNLKQIIDLKKPVIWTLHDMWAFTGGCHYSGICDHFARECGDCYFLRNPGPEDISHKGWLKKQELYAGTDNIVFVTCSNWLRDTARKSSLLSGFRIETIPNPIDTALFCPKDKKELRTKWKMDPDAKIILFGAANIMDRRKGITYLVDALIKLKASYKDQQKIEIVIFGKNKSFDTSHLPFIVHNLSVINSQETMAELYNLADVFVLPSLEDNLPNTVMESMSCSTPVIAFNTGGLPDMVDHRLNGYLAEYRSSDDLAYGIEWVLNNNNEGTLSFNARQKVLDNFSNEAVANQYIDLYQSVLNG